MPERHTIKEQVYATKDIPLIAVYKEYSSLNPQDFSFRIKEIETSLAADRLSSLRLFVLTSHPRNPKPDYPRALRELEAYMSFADETEKEALNALHHILKKLNALSEENKVLNRKLELLRSLDVEIEKRKIRAPQRK